MKVRFKKEQVYWFAGYRLTPDENMECELPAQIATPSVVKDLLVRYKGLVEVIDEGEAKETKSEPEVKAEVKVVVEETPEELDTVTGSEESSMDEGEDSPEGEIDTEVNDAPESDEE